LLLFGRAGPVSSNQGTYLLACTESKGRWTFRTRYDFLDQTPISQQLYRKPSPTVPRCRSLPFKLLWSPTSALSKVVPLNSRAADCEIGLKPKARSLDRLLRESRYALGGGRPASEKSGI